MYRNLVFFANTILTDASYINLWIIYLFIYSIIIDLLS